MVTLLVENAPLADNKRLPSFLGVTKNGCLFSLSFF